VSDQEAEGVSRTAARRLAGPVTLAAVVASLAVAAATQWGELPSYDWRFAPGWLALSVLASTGLLVAVSALWCSLLASLGEPVPWRRGQGVFAKSLLARYVPTSALSLLVRLVLAERLGVPKRVCFASVVYELALSLAGAAVVAAWFVLTWPALEGEAARYAVLAVVPLVLVTLHPAVFGPVARALLRRLGREPLPRVLGAVQVWRFLALYTCTTLLGGVALYLFVLALYPADLDDLPVIVAAVPVGGVVAAVTFILPAGLGSRDITMAVVLATVLPAAVAVAAVAGFRVLQLTVELAWAAVAVGSARGSETERPHRRLAPSTASAGQQPQVGDDEGNHVVERGLGERRRGGVAAGDHVSLVDRREDGADHERDRQGSTQVLGLKDDAKRIPHRPMLTWQRR
jgi:uncharacterized membrane protein YbhN (UPF0104 family)